jgi:hypothetical protein
LNGFSKVAAKEAPALSSLSKMMIDCTRAALSGREYENALEYALAVASVDEHPGVTVALAVTVLEILHVVLEAPQTITTKNDLLEALSAGHVDPRTIRERLLDGTALHVIELIRSYSHGKTNVQAKSDGQIRSLIESINSAVAEGRNKQEYYEHMKHVEVYFKLSLIIVGAYIIPSSLILFGKTDTISIVILVVQTLILFINIVIVFFFNIYLRKTDRQRITEKSAESVTDRIMGG